MLARCPSCRNTFGTERAGRQECPVCGKPLLVPEPPGAAAEPPRAEIVSEPEGTPWERRAELGFWQGWGQTMQLALLEPGKLFASARLDRGSAQLGFAVLTTSAFWIVGQVLQSALSRGRENMLQRLFPSVWQNPDAAPTLRWLTAMQQQSTAPATVALFAALTPAIVFVLVYANAAVTHAIAALLRQSKRGFPATFAACAYGCAPLALLAVPECGWVVAVIWVIVLTGIGMKITHGISAGGAVASVLVPYVVLCCALFFATGSIMFAVQRSLSTP